MSNIRRGRHRSKKIHIWVDPKQLKKLDELCERQDLTRPAALEAALNVWFLHWGESV